MKKMLFLMFLTVASLNTYSQDVTFPLDPKTGEITYSEIVSVDSASSDLLLSRAKEWFVHNFNSANDVIQMDDKERSKVIGRTKCDVYTSYLSSVGKNPMGFVKFTIEVQTKEERYKYIFTDFWHDGHSPTPGDLRAERPGGGLLSMGMQNWNGVKTQTNDFVQTLIKSLKEAMSKDLSGSSDW